MYMYVVVYGYVKLLLCNMISYINIVLYVYVLYGNIKVVGNSVG